MLINQFKKLNRLTNYIEVVKKVLRNLDLEYYSKKLQTKKKNSPLMNKNLLPLKKITEFVKSK